MFDRERNAANAANDEARETLRRISEFAHGHLSECVDADMTTKENPPSPSTARNELAAESEGGTHSMIVLGYYEKTLETGETMTMYVLWNWWETMPLVSVSLDYMIWAGCRVAFLDLDRPRKDAASFTSMESMNQRCILDASTADHAEDTTYEEDDEMPVTGLIYVHEDDYDYDY